MRVRHVAGAGVLLAVLGLAASAATGSTRRQHAKTLNVWLQVDAQGWRDIVGAATKAFSSAHPGVGVTVSYLSWDEHLARLDAALATGAPPDVVEMANTEMTPYMATGKFVALPPKYFDNAKTWLDALRASATYDGKLYGVPYYAGSRATIIRTDYWQKVGFGKKPPATLADFYAAGVKLMKRYGKTDPMFSALYLPGQNWYAATSWVYDYGGSIAVRVGGRWKGNLDSKQSLAGLTELKKDVLALSRADRRGTQADEWTTFAQGHIASMVGSGWEMGLITDKKAGDPKLARVLNAYPMPGHVKGKPMPTFLGGSDLAVPASSMQKALAADWIRDFTSTTAERQLAAEAGLIPNTKTLLGVNDAKKLLAPFARAAQASWFVPTAAHWPEVESAKVMETLYIDIFTGKKTVKAAATAASDEITRILNAG